MKRILGIAMVIGVVGALTVMAQEVKLGEVEVIELGNDVKLELVLIPAGKFKMGFTKKEWEDFKMAMQDDIKKIFKKELGKKELAVVDLVMSFQGKQHEVTLTKPFYMGKNEVTQEQWEAVMGNIPSDLKWKGAKLPVTQVSWVDCQEFIKKLNMKTDGGYRLPTEAEWEYACRAGSTTAYSFGDEITQKDANYHAGLKREKIVAVGSYKPNAFSLNDMHGNVDEWCEDWFADYPAEAATDPKGPATGTRRVLRGGCFVSDKLSIRSSVRIYNPPADRSNFDGFRLARTAGIKAVAAPAAPKPDPAKLKQEEEAKTKQMVLVKLAIEKEMVLIPAGKFKMGSPASEKGRNNNEKQHEVTLTKPFYMGKYEVTQEQWKAVMGNNPNYYKGTKLPVTMVSWNDCQEFIKKLNAKTDGSYRLPTEAEWEYACRAGTTTAYSFGDKITPQDANYGDSKLGKPVAVGSYEPNAFGLYHMHGNTWEWCEDRYADYPTGVVTDPRGPAAGEHRVLRGGSFLGDVLLARCSFRIFYTPTDRFVDYGFRLARTK